MTDVFSTVASESWLQGRHLFPLLEKHGASVDGTVLDLGCGASPFRRFFPRARQFLRIDRSNDDPEEIIADASALPLPDASVDCVILSQVIGDVADLPALFREIGRVLVPGGSILVYETTSYPQHDLPHDCWRVLPGGLEWAAGQAGLEMAEVEYLGGYFGQLAMHWNIFIVGDLGGHAVTRPLARLARAVGNLACAGLDRLWPRPTLATDYFARLVKTPPAGRRI